MMQSEDEYKVLTCEGMLTFAVLLHCLSWEIYYVTFICL